MIIVKAEFINKMIINNLIIYARSYHGSTILGVDKSKFIRVRVYADSNRYSNR